MILATLTTPAKCSPDDDALLFTVLINAYNYGCYISEAINSALRQTLARDQFEVIVIDDGSCDDTAERVARFGDSVRYFYQENGGQAAAFNTGITNAKGKFVAFLDADDMWGENKLETVREFLEANADIDFVYHSLTQIDAVGNVLGYYPEYASNSVVRDPLDAFLGQRLPEAAPTSGMVCRLQTLRAICPVPLGYRICADSFVHVAAPLVASSIGFIAQPLTSYRLHSSNNFNSYDSKAGRYLCREDVLLLNKLKLDLKSVEELAVRFGLNLNRYIELTSVHLITQEALQIRKCHGVMPALTFLTKSMRKLGGRNIAHTFYRSLSGSLRLILGARLFDILAAY